MASGVAVARGGAIRGDADGATLDGTTRGAGQAVTVTAVDVHGGMDFSGEYFVGWVFEDASFLGEGVGWGFTV